MTTTRDPLLFSDGTPCEPVVEYIHPPIDVAMFRRAMSSLPSITEAEARRMNKRMGRNPYRALAEHLLMRDDRLWLVSLLRFRYHMEEPSVSGARD